MEHLDADERVVLNIPARELRDIFNALEIARKGREGLLIRRRTWTGTRRPRHLSSGSRSVMWGYYMPNGWLLAIAHVYLARGGQVISEPDPKEISIDQLVLRPYLSDFAE